MKKIIFILTIIFTFLACQKDFLDEKPVTILTQNFYKTAEGLKALVNGTYQVFRFKSDYNSGNMLFGSANDCEVWLQNQDDRVPNALYRPDGWGADAGTDGQRMGQQVNTFLGSISGGYVEGMYPIINRCNVFLENFPELGESDKAKVEGSKGEILFIRAYCYYLLTNVLGDVPLVLHSFEGMPSAFYFPKSSIEDIYKVMISDLREAVELLPVQQVTSGQSVDATLGRVNKEVAATLLAKLYLHRAQAAGWQDNAETYLAMLYKGNVATDLDSSIYYATIAIDSKKGQTAFGGLAPDFASLWAVSPLVTTDVVYARDKVSEVMLSAQYTFTGDYNGRYGGSQIIHFYDQDYTQVRAGVDRNAQDYPRPFRAVGPNDWAYDMYTDKANDSRFYKTFIPSYASNNATTATSGVKWNQLSSFYYNAYLKDMHTDMYGGDSARVGVSKIEYQKRSLVFIENSKDEPIDSLWINSQPNYMVARWTAGSPDGTGYVATYLKSKVYPSEDSILNGQKIPTSLKPSALVDPLNPVVTDVSNREVRYRLTVDPEDQDRYDCDVYYDAAMVYLSPAKYWDLNRGGGTNDRGNGSIDIPLFRLAETYLIRAEAYGRQGNFPAAIDDINVIRQRAAYHPNENRSDILATYEPGILTGRLDIPADEKTAPYTVNTDTYEKIKVTGEEWTAGTAKAKMENYPPTATSDLDRFIHFIYNEKAREFLFEMQITEDLHNAGILYDRVYYRDYFGAPVESTGTTDYPFPYDANDVAEYGTRGAIGTGRGQFDKHHTFKAWPIGFLQLLTDENGNALSAAARAEYQNPGY